MQWHIFFLLLLLYLLEIIDRNNTITLSIDVNEEKTSVHHDLTQVYNNSRVAERKAKELLCVRHGVSLANEFIGNRWGSPSFRDDPTLIDAPLSKRGLNVTQTKLPEQLLYQEDLRSFLVGSRNQKSNGSDTSSVIQDGGVELVLISPLTRCLQTYVYGIEPVLSELLAKQDGEAIADFANGDAIHSDDSRLPTSKLPIPVMAIPLLRERVYTISDTGRSTAVLEQEFPTIDFSECHRLRNKRQALNGSEDDDVWWYTGKEAVTFGDGSDSSTEYDEWRPHGQGQWYAVPGEPKVVFESRMEELRDWLFKRKETKILVVAHWEVLRYLSGGTKWKNSEAKIIPLLPSSRL